MQQAIKQLDKDEVSTVLKEFWKSYQKAIIKKFESLDAEHQQSNEIVQNSIDNFSDKFTKIMQENENLIKQSIEQNKTLMDERIALKTSAKLLQQQIELNDDLQKKLLYTKSSISALLPHYSSIIK